MNIDQLFDKVRTLPVIPRVLQALLHSFGNPDISSRALAQLISGDPALRQLLRFGQFGALSLATNGQRRLSRRCNCWG